MSIYLDNEHTKVDLLKMHVHLTEYLVQVGFKLRDVNISKRRGGFRVYTAIRRREFETRAAEGVKTEINGK